MNKYIKQLIEDYTYAFNPGVISNQRSSRIDREIVSDIVGECPEDLNELREIVLKRVMENPKKPYLLNIDTSRITSMFELFNGNKLQVYGNEIFKEIEELDLSTWDTSNVTDMGGMFNMCTNLKKLNISNFDTSEVTSMKRMFDNCRNLVSLDLSNFDTTNVTNMADMFENCNLLESLNISSFNTENVTQMYCMFYNCKALTDIDFTNFSMKSVTAKWQMFLRVPKKTQNKFKRQLGVDKI